MVFVLCSFFCEPQVKCSFTMQLNPFSLHRCAPYLQRVYLLSFANCLVLDRFQLRLAAVLVLTRKISRAKLYILPLRISDSQKRSLTVVLPPNTAMLCTVLAANG